MLAQPLFREGTAEGNDMAEGPDKNRKFGPARTGKETSTGINGV